MTPADPGARYFIGYDNSGHEYLVPVGKVRDWLAWTDLDDDDERGWACPEYADRIDGGTLTFSEPRVEKL